MAGLPRIASCDGSAGKAVQPWCASRPCWLAPPATLLRNRLQILWEKLWSEVDDITHISTLMGHLYKARRRIVKQ